METSIGLDRMFLATLCSALQTETLEDGSERVVLRLPKALVPYQVAILPLVKKDGLPDKARAILDTLKVEYMCQYDEKDAIGRRYRRQDAIGTPFAITVDHQTLEDQMVTIRERDSMTQERIPINDLSDYLHKGIRA